MILVLMILLTIKTDWDILCIKIIILVYAHFLYARRI